jgi:hypothetical protein
MSPVEETRTGCKVAVEGLRQGHQARSLVLQALGDGELRPLRMAHLLPGGPAAPGKPAIKLGKARPAPLKRLAPDLPAPVLNVLLDDTLLPARRPVAELGLKEIVRAHRLEARVHRALLPPAHAVHRRLHVVVDASARNPAEGAKGRGVRIEEHLVALAWIGHQPERPARRQLHVRKLQAPAQTAHKGVLAAPVELERLPKLEHQRHVCGALRRIRLLGLPAAHKRAHPPIAAAITQRPHRRKEHRRRAPLAPATVAVRLEPRGEQLRPPVELARAPSRRVLRFHHRRPAQPPPHRVPREPRAPRHLAQRHPVPEMHPSDLRQHSHADHSLFSCSFFEQASQSRGSVLRENYLPKWVSFGWTSTAAAPGLALCVR